MYRSKSVLRTFSQDPLPESMIAYLVAKAPLNRTDNNQIMPGCAYRTPPTMNCVSATIEVTLRFLHLLPQLNDCKGLDDFVRKMLCDPAFVVTQYTTHRIPKKSGGDRVIEAPSPLLKRIQRAILDAYLYPCFPISKTAMGFAPRRSIKLNAVTHFDMSKRHKQVLLKMDMRDFFPSIPTTAVLCSIQEYYRYCCDNHCSVILPPLEDYSEAWREQSPTPQLSKARFWGQVPAVGGSYFRIDTISNPALPWGLVTLCSLKGRLPQGAPTSPTLSNLALLRFDNVASAVIKRSTGGVYTRYADDMIVSVDTVSEAVSAKRLLSKLILRTGYLSINEEKTHILRNHLPQRVTGININDKVSVSRWKRDNVRAEMHNLVTGKSQLKDNQLARLAGHRAFMRGVDSDGWDSRCESLYQKVRALAKGE